MMKGPKTSVVIYRILPCASLRDAPSLTLITIH